MRFAFSALNILFFISWTASAGNIPQDQYLVEANSLVSQIEALTSQGHDSTDIRKNLNELNKAQFSHNELTAKMVYIGNTEATAIDKIENPKNKIEVRISELQALGFTVVLSPELVRGYEPTSFSSDKVIFVNTFSSFLNEKAYYGVLADAYTAKIDNLSDLFLLRRSNEEIISSKEAQEIDGLLKMLLKSQRYEYALVSDGPYPAYHITGGNGPLTKVLRAYPKLKIKLSPFRLARSNSNGQFNPQTGEYTIGSNVRSLFDMKDVTLHHELLHARFSFDMLGFDRSIFSMNFSDKEAGVRAHKRNPYLPQFSAEEIATHLQDAFIKIRAKQPVQSKIMWAREMANSAVKNIQSILERPSIFEIRASNAILRNENYLIKFEKQQPKDHEEALQWVKKALPRFIEIQDRITNADRSISDSALSKTDASKILSLTLKQTIMIGNGKSLCSSIFN